MASSVADPMVDAMIEEGAQAIDALPEHAKRISGLLASHFPAQTLEAVHTAMRPSVEGAKGGVNAKVAELSSLVREEAAVAGAQFRASMEGMATAGKDYYWSRGTGLEKLF